MNIYKNTHWIIWSINNNLIASIVVIVVIYIPVGQFDFDYQQIIYYVYNELKPVRTG